MKPFWRILYYRGADVILSGHPHRYERYAPITPGGVRDPKKGIRQFVLGTRGNSGGGEIYYDHAPGVQIVKPCTPGVLKLNLGAGS